LRRRAVQGPRSSAWLLRNLNASAAMSAATPPPTKAIRPVLQPEHITEKGDEHDHDHRLRRDHLEVLQLANLEPPRQCGLAVEKELGQPKANNVEDRPKQEQIENLERGDRHGGDIRRGAAARPYFQDCATDGDRSIDGHDAEHGDATHNGYDQEIAADPQERLHPPGCVAR